MAGLRAKIQKCLVCHKTSANGLEATGSCKRSTGHRQITQWMDYQTDDAAHSQIMRALQHSIRTMGLRAFPSPYVFLLSKKEACNIAIDPRGGQWG
jgi:hypothetical protein